MSDKGDSFWDYAPQPAWPDVPLPPKGAASPGGKKSALDLSPETFLKIHAAKEQAEKNLQAALAPGDPAALETARQRLQDIRDLYGKAVETAQAQARAEADAEALKDQAKNRATQLALLEAKQWAAEQIAEKKAAADVRLMEAVKPVRMSEVQVQQRPYRVDKMLVSGVLSLLWAAPKAGKTTLTVNLLGSLTTGAQFLGCYDAQPVEQGRTVGYLSYEMTQDQLVPWCEAHGVDTERVALWDLKGRPNPLASGVGREGLAEWLAAEKVEFLVVDTLSRACAGSGKNENDASDMTEFLSMLLELTTGAGVTDVLVLHHTGWNGDRLRGSTALAGFPDMLWGLTRDEADRRFLETDGRLNPGDELLEPTELEYEPATHTLTLTGVTQAQAKAEEKAQAQKAKKLDAFFQLQHRAELLAGVLTEAKVSQTQAFAKLKADHGINVRRDDRSAVVAFAVEHYGVHVGGVGGPGSGGPKQLSRPVDTTDQSHQSGPVS